MTYPADKRVIEPNFKALTDHDCEYRDGAIYFSTEHMLGNPEERHPLLGWFVEKLGRQQANDVADAKAKHLQAQNGIAYILPHLYTVDVGQPTESRIGGHKLRVTSKIMDNDFITLIKEKELTKHRFCTMMNVIKHFLVPRVETTISEQIIEMNPDEIMNIIRSYTAPFRFSLSGQTLWRKVLNHLHYSLNQDEIRLCVVALDHILESLGSARKAADFITDGYIRFSEDTQCLHIKKAMFFEELARPPGAAPQERNTLVFSWMEAKEGRSNGTLKDMPVEVIQHITSFVR